MPVPFLPIPHTLQVCEGGAVNSTSMNRHLISVSKNIEKIQGKNVFTELPLFTSMLFSALTRLAPMNPHVSIRYQYSLC